MKLLPKSPDDVRVNTEDSLGHGMDAVIMLTLFLGAGYGLDRWFGTLPVFMIVMTVLGSIGLFARFYYSYKDRMDQHDRERNAKLVGRAMSQPQATPTVDVWPADVASDGDVA